MATDKALETVRRVESQNCSLSPQELRLWSLKFSMGVRLDQPAEYAIVTGCRSPHVFTHLWSFVKLLRHYDVDYTFLSEERCCGNSYLNMLDPKEDANEIEAFEERARYFQGQNVARIRELGAKKIVTACAGCNTRYNQFQGGGDFEVLHYTQFLLPRVRGLRLDARVDFYEGCHKMHRTKGFKIDTLASRALLAGIEGLVVNDIPNFCCRIASDRIFGAVQSGTLITPTGCCKSELFTHNPSDSIKVEMLSEILCQAAGIA